MRNLVKKIKPCLWCGKKFLGISCAKYCSVKCRKDIEHARVKGYAFHKKMTLPASVDEMRRRDRNRRLLVHDKRLEESGYAPKVERRITNRFCGKGSRIVLETRGHCPGNFGARTPWNP